jgi:outer membrane receptor protein involved in Fe transport
VQGTVRARYAWLLGDYDASWQVAAQYADSSYSSIVAEEREKQDSYSTVDASIAISKNNWSVEIFGQNLTDERADLFINTQDDIRRITTNRPRTYGLRVSYRY